MLITLTTTDVIIDNFDNHSWMFYNHVNYNADAEDWMFWTHGIDFCDNVPSSEEMIVSFMQVIFLLLRGTEARKKVPAFV